MEQAIGTGRAAEHFQKIIEAQGGNPAVVDDPALLPQAAEVELFAAPRRGFVARVEPRAVGRGITALGGGRTTMEDTLDLSVGFMITARPGDWVEQGEPMATIFARDRAGVESGRAALAHAITIADEADPPLPLVSHRVSSAGRGAACGRVSAAIAVFAIVVQATYERSTHYSWRSACLHESPDSPGSAPSPCPQSSSRSSSSSSSGRDLAQSSGLDGTERFLAWLGVAGVLLALVAVHIVMGRRLLAVARGIPEHV